MATSGGSIVEVQGSCQTHLPILILQIPPLPLRLPPSRPSHLDPPNTSQHSPSLQPRYWNGSFAMHLAFSPCTFRIEAVCCECPSESRPFAIQRSNFTNSTVVGNSNDCVLNNWNALALWTFCRNVLSEFWSYVHEQHCYPIKVSRVEYMFFIHNYSNTPVNLLPMYWHWRRIWCGP